MPTTRHPNQNKPHQRNPPQQTTTIPPIQQQQAPPPPHLRQLQRSNKSQVTFQGLTRERLQRMQLRRQATCTKNIQPIQKLPRNKRMTTIYHVSIKVMSPSTRSGHGGHGRGALSIIFFEHVCSGETLRAGWIKLYIAGTASGGRPVRRLSVTAISPVTGGTNGRFPN